MMPAVTFEGLTIEGDLCRKNATDRLCRGLRRQLSSPDDTKPTFQYR